MQKELKEKIDLLNDKGELNFKGYYTKMNFVYNKDKIKSFPLKLKEWNFYQFNKENYILQLTIGHVSYMCNVSLTLIDIETGNRKEISSMKPFYIPNLDLNPEENSKIEYSEENFNMVFEVQDDKRILSFKGSNKIYENIELNIEIENDKENKKMVIATPFKNKKQFYLNYKENYYKVNGYVIFDDKKYNFNNSKGLIDWGRGVWPYKHEWYWGNLTSSINGVPFGINIGYGFGDLSNATENIYFYDKKAYKLGKLIIEKDDDDEFAIWTIEDEDKKMHLEFTPFYDNYTKNRYLIINTSCHQLFGYYSGYIIVDNKKIIFNEKLAFIEHAVNRW